MLKIDPKWLIVFALKFSAENPKSGFRKRPKCRSDPNIKKNIRNLPNKAQKKPHNMGVVGIFTLACTLSLKISTGI